ncbi:MAG TPA: hypothetical protein QGF58_15520 [Myxococcota bacterium]|nr:hypothetical protein [Myxococcota bacterium]
MLLFALLSCERQLAPVADSDLRPEGSPDVLVISVSGHCTSCVGWSYNDEYMLDRGTPGAIATALREQGHHAEIWDYADALYTWESSRSGEVLVWGFLDLVAHLEWVEENWIAEYDNPTRVVVVAHSHGVVWAHSALLAAEGVPVEVLVDLDGVCLSWESDESTVGIGDDWTSVIDSHVAEYGDPWWFDLADACDSWAIPGLQNPADIEDVVPDNVILNLEVGSSDWLLYDAQHNRRLDGTQTGIHGFTSAENHAGLLRPTSDAMEWVVARVVDALAAEEPR